MIEEIARRLHEVRWKTLSPAAQRKLLLCLLANVSVGVAGGSAMRLPRPAPARGHLLLDGGETGNPRDAAFCNAALMHSRTQDDFHPIGNLHIATIVLPALIAEAERRASGGEEFLDAMAVGYACSAGLSRQFSPMTTPRGLRSTSLYTSIGAAAAVARLRGQDPAGVANTMALSSQSAFGTTQCWRDGSDEYQLHTANAASQALLCAELTEEGVVGGAHALDGPSGFYSALMGQTPTFESIASDFEPNAAILDSVLKRYPVSGICQPVVRLTEGLRAQLIGRRVERVRLEMNSFEMNYPGTLNAGPEFRSFSDKLMSARYCVASVIEAGRFDFDAFMRPLSREASRVVAATDVVPGEGLGTLSCRITITAEDGSTIKGELRNGGSELAIDWTTIGDWCADLWTSAGRSVADCERAREAVLALPRTTFEMFRVTLRGSCVS